MTALSLAAVMTAAVPLGMAHALDPDHVLAVSGLSLQRSAKPGRRIVAYAAQWAAGHGGLLLLVTAAALLFHVRLPAPIPGWAERLVGVILIATGLSICGRLLGEIRRRRDATAPVPPRHRHPRAPFFVGVVHGLAGSGAALALIPATLMQPAVGLAYVLTFSLGVLAGMVAFGQCLRGAQGALADRAPRWAEITRGGLGVVAAGVGVFWLAGG